MYPNDHLSNWFSGQGLWNDTPEQEWNSWPWQLKHRIQTMEQLKNRMELIFVG